MRKLLIAGNWKMNTESKSAAKLAQEVASGAGSVPSIEIAVCPPFPYLAAVNAILAGRVGLGAQNMFHLENGAYTGETSASMLLDCGCKYVILGHSERRHVLKETDAFVNKKLVAALAAGLIPIFCVGETLNEREDGRTAGVIREQFEEGLAGVDAGQAAKIVIAYEPVWAIGTGKVATPDQAEEVHSDLRNLLTERYNAELSQQVRILYGGSVKASNAKEIISQQNVDGALVGGASLQSADFLGIAQAAAATLSNG